MKQVRQIACRRGQESQQLSQQWSEQRARLPPRKLDREPTDRKKISSCLFREFQLLEDQYQLAKQANLQLLKKLKGKKAQLEAAKRENAQIQKQLAEIKRQVSFTAQQDRLAVQSMQTQLQLQRKTSQVLQQRIKEVLQINQIFEAKNKQLSAQSGHLYSELQSKAKEAKAAQRELAQCREQQARAIEQLQVEFREREFELMQKLKRGEQEVQRLKARCQRHQQNAINSEEINSVHLSELEQCEYRGRVLASENETLKRCVESLEKENKRAARQKRNCEKEIEELTVQIEDILQKFAQDRRRLETELEAREKEVETLGVGHSQDEIELSSLRRVCDQRQEELAYLGRKAELLEQNNKRILSELEQARAQLSIKRKAEEDLVKQNLVLKGEIRMLSEGRQVVEAQLQQCREKAKKLKQTVEDSRLFAHKLQISYEKVKVKLQMKAELGKMAGEPLDEERQELELRLCQAEAKAEREKTRFQRQSEILNSKYGEICTRLGQTERKLQKAKERAKLAEEECLKLKSQVQTHLHKQQYLQAVAIQKQKQLQDLRKSGREEQDTRQSRSKRNQVQQLSAQMNRLRLQMVRLTEDKLEAQQRLKKQQVQSAAVRRMNDQLRDKLAQFELRLGVSNEDEWQLQQLGRQLQMHLEQKSGQEFIKQPENSIEF